MGRCSCPHRAQCAALSAPLHARRAAPGSGHRPSPLFPRGWTPLQFCWSTAAPAVSWWRVSSTATHGRRSPGWRPGWPSWWTPMRSTWSRGFPPRPVAAASAASTRAGFSLQQWLAASIARASLSSGAGKARPRRDGLASSDCMGLISWSDRGDLRRLGFCWWTTSSPQEPLWPPPPRFSAGPAPPPCMPSAPRIDHDNPEKPFPQRDPCRSSRPDSGLPMP